MTTWKTHSKTKTIIYWAATVLIGFVMLSGGMAYLARQTDVVARIAQLGYPSYVLAILGVMKLAGGIVIVAPGLPRLKEWAYAGVMINLTGAAASHLARGNAAGDVIVPLVIAIIGLVSWATRPERRRLEATP